MPEQVEATMRPEPRLWDEKAARPRRLSDHFMAGAMWSADWKTGSETFQTRCDRGVLRCRGQPRFFAGFGFAVLDLPVPADFARVADFFGISEGRRVLPSLGA